MQFELEYGEDTKYIMLIDPEETDPLKEDQLIVDHALMDYTV